MLKRDKPRDPARPDPPAALSDVAMEAQAAADSENPPWMDEELAQAKLSPRLRVVRRALRLTQEEFAERYMIPVQTLRAWEQGVTEPDAAGRAYIRAIIGDAEGVARALHARPPVPAA
jgi:putative transcriptional regulator